MPRTIRQSLKYDVFAIEQGIRLGRPQDMLIDPEKHRVAVVLLVHKGLPQVATVIRAEEVGSFAEDTLPVPGLSSVHLAYQLPGSVELLERGLHFRGRDVITDAGHNFGRIIDVLLDDDGRVIHYRVAKGLLRRLLRLTKPVTPSQIQTSGEHVAVIQSDAEPESDETSRDAESPLGDG